MSLVALSLQGLSKVYGDVRALKGVSLEVAPGQLLALLGPSGCGKTTLLRLVAGLLEPDAGEIKLSGHNVAHLPPEKRDIGMVFQRPTLFPHLSVAANVGFGLKMRGASRREVRRRVGEALESVQLTGFEGRKPRQLSGGQQQRVAIARAVVTEPKLLLMDEPFSSLDATLREEMRELVRDLQRSLGVTTLFVTHDQMEALELADALGVMFEGQVAQLGTPQEVFERPASAPVAQFMGGTNLLTGRLEGEHLATLIGRVTLPSTPYRSGEVTAVIRPEYVELCRSGGPITGHVTKAVYRGGVTRYEVAVYPRGNDEQAEPETLVAHLGGGAAFAVGEHIGVSLPAERLWVLPPGEDSGAEDGSAKDGAARATSAELAA